MCNFSLNSFDKEAWNDIPDNEAKLPLNLIWRFARTKFPNTSCAYTVAVVDSAGKSTYLTVRISVAPADKPTHPCEDCRALENVCYQGWQGKKEACRANCNSTYSDGGDASNCYNEQCYAQIPAWQAVCSKIEDDCNVRNEDCK